MFMSKIDKLANKKKELMLEREQLQRAMHERNSKRETRMQELEHEAQNDYEETNKKVVELNRKIDKVLRDIESEQIYVTEVADAERQEYLQLKKNEQVDKQKVKGVK